MGVVIEAGEKIVTVRVRGVVDNLRNIILSSKCLGKRKEYL